MKKNSNYTYSIYTGSKLRNKNYEDVGELLWNSGN